MGEVSPSGPSLKKIIKKELDKVGKCDKVSIETVENYGKPHLSNQVTHDHQRRDQNGKF
jgi:hypothetical protein